MAGAHFIVQRGGAVKFQGYDQWLEPDKDGNCHLPEHGILGMRLEAVDASGMHIMYHSFDSLGTPTLLSICVVIVYISSICVWPLMKLKFTLPCSAYIQHSVLHVLLIKSLQFCNFRYSILKFGDDCNMLYLRL